MSTLVLATLAVLSVGARPADRPATRWAVLIASDGTEESPGEGRAESQAEEIAGILAATYGYDPILTIYGERVVTKEFFFELERLESGVARGDSVFVYIDLPEADIVRAARPGMHWVPWDGRPEEPWTLISPAAVADTLGRLEGASILLTSPSCLAEAARGEEDYTQQRQIFLAEPPNLHTLSRCGGPLRTRPTFGEAVALALEPAPDDPEEFTAEDLAGYIRSHLQLRSVPSSMDARARRLLVNYQRPFASKEEFVFVRQRATLDPDLLARVDPSQPPRTRVAGIYALVEFVFSQPEGRAAALAVDLNERLLAIGADRDESAAVRNAALAAVGRLGQSSALGPLADIARTDRSSVAVEAVRTIEGLGGDEGLETLEALLQANDPPVRTAAIHALSHLGSKSSLPAIIEGMAGDVDEESNLAAIEAIRLLSGDDKETAVAALSILLERGDPVSSELVCQEAIAALGALGEPAAIPLLLGYLGQGGDLGATAASAIARIEVRESARPEIEAALIDSLGDQRLASSAARALGRHGSSAAVEPLLERALDSGLESKARASAVGALGAIGDRSVVEPLVGLLAEPGQDPDRDIRLAACQALGELGDPAAREWLLIAARKDADPYVRSEAEKAAEAVTRAGLAEAAENLEVAQLVASLGDRDRETREQAVEEFSTLSDATAIPALRDALSDESPIRRGAAATALGQRPESPEALEALIEAARDPQELVRAAAIASMGRFPDPRVPGELQRLAESERATRPRRQIAASLAEQSGRLALEGEVAAAREVGELSAAVARTLFVQVYGNRRAHDPVLAESLRALGRADAAGGDLEMAQRRLEEALTVLYEAEVPNSPLAGELLADLAEVVETAGETRRAESYLFDSLSAFERAEDAERVAEALDRLAGFYERTGDFEAAREFSERAEAAREAALKGARAY